VAASFLAAMVLLTVADVELRTFFSYPIRGMLELIELGLACTIFIALPAVFLRDEHLVVDVIDHLVRPSAVRLLDLAGANEDAFDAAVSALAIDRFARHPGWLPRARDGLDAIEGRIWRPPFDPVSCELPWGWPPRRQRPSSRS